MSKLQQLKGEGKVVLDLDFRKNSLLDQSGNGNDVTTISGSPVYKNTEHGRGLFCGGNTDKLTIADSEELRLTNGYILVFGDFVAKGSTTQVLVEKRTGTTNYDFGLNAAGFIFYDGITGRSLITTTEGKNMVGVKFVASGIPVGFIDGHNAGNFDGSSTVTTDSSVVTIGNFSGNSYPAKTTITKVVILNDATITERDISQIYDEYMQERGVLEQPRRGYINTAPPVDSNCVLAYDMETKMADKMADLSGNGRVGTITSSVSTKLRSNLPAMKHASGSLISLPADLALSTVHTLEFVAKGNTAATMLWAKDTNNFAFYYNGTTSVIYGASGQSVSWTVTALGSEEHHFVIDRNGADVSLYVDGVFISTQTIIAGSTLTVAASSLAGYYWIGDVGYCQIYSTSKGATWAGQRYKRYAKHLSFQNNLDDTPPTLANVTSGLVGKSEFSVSTGTWKISEDSSKKKWIENVVAGVVRQSLVWGAGTQVYEVQKGAEGNTMTFGINALLPDAITTTGQNTYRLRWDSSERLVLDVILNGALGSTLFLTSTAYLPSNTKFNIAISWSNKGELTVYDNGAGAWRVSAAAGGSNPTTNTQITSGKHVVAEGGAGDKFRILGVHEGVLDIGQLEELY